jgi:hypothetical protein
MGKKNRLSRDQKRKAKLAERAGRGVAREALAYGGGKYKTDELIPVFLETELAIHEVFVTTQRQLTDRTVEAALEKMIIEMRNGSLLSLSEDPDGDMNEGGEENLIAWRIRSNWEQLFQETGRVSTKKLIGVLRTILNSIRIWSTTSRDSRGYLNYIEGFLKSSGAPLGSYDEHRSELAESEKNQLLGLGRDWCEEEDAEAAAQFRSLTDEMIRAGQAQDVVEVCNHLMGESPPRPILNELMAISIHAQQGQWRLKG